MSSDRGTTGTGGVSRTGLLLLVLVAAGRRHDRATWDATLANPRVQGMVGLWTVELQLDRPGLDSMPRTAAGVISLTLNQEGGSAPGFTQPPVFFGTYDIAFGAFKPLGYEPTPAQGIPAVVGRVRGDSLDLKLAPDSRLTITLTGALARDSIAGRWATEHRHAGIEGAGTFLLRRR